MRWLSPGMELGFGPEAARLPDLASISCKKIKAPRGGPDGHATNALNGCWSAAVNSAYRSVVFVIKPLLTIKIGIQKPRL
jgi:hypothetical protein